MPVQSDADLYRAALAASGLSSRRFAEWLAWRDERTSRRWSAGGPMPPIVRDQLRWFVALAARSRARFVAIASRGRP